MTTIVTLLAFAIIPGGGAAGSSCLAPSGAKIVARDVVPAIPAFAQLPADQMLGFAPQPGVTRTFGAAELLQWLSRNRIPAPDLVPSVCFAWPLVQPDPLALKAVMEQALPPGGTVQVLEFSQFPHVPGELHFPLSSFRQATSPSQPSLWKGYVEYLPGARQELWARVEVRVPSSRVVATRNIRAAEVIDESMVRLETTPGPLLPPGMAQDPSDILGRVARQLVQSGSVVPLSALDKPLAVKSGDPVRINVVVGAARIGLDGVAVSSAAEGGMVGVKVVETGRTVRGRVASPGYIVLDMGKR